VRDHLSTTTHPWWNLGTTTSAAEPGVAKDMVEKMLDACVDGCPRHIYVVAHSDGTPLDIVQVPSAKPVKK